ncbi:MAG: hypothetical protein J6Z79_05485 [Clostridia bacterium]|nr:hypothetical protein [Clostridia bacterium]
MKEREKKKVTEDFALLETGRAYNRQIGLYDTVTRNERFYRGDQWHGIAANGLPTPVFNLFKRVLNYFVSTIMSQKVRIHYTAEGEEALFDPEKQRKADETSQLLSRYANYRLEKDKVDELLGRGLLDAALTGDLFAYVYWDPSKRTARGYRGDYVTTLVDGTRVFFGDVNTPDVEAQPYILISGRDLVERLRAEARENGADRENVEKIRPDTDVFEEAGDYGKRELAGTKAGYVIKLYKKNGAVHYRKSCRGAVICPERNTGLSRYPVAHMTWEPVKNSYHGHAAATGLVDNQLYINKAFAMVMKHMLDVSFSKVVYNANVIDEWTNEIGEAVAVNGPVENVALQLTPGTMQDGFLDVINMTVKLTKELMGATDAALGNVRPDNTSAIIALQQSSAIPLEIQKNALYDFTEQLGMIWLDFILHYYDASRIMLFREDGALAGGCVDPGEAERFLFSCVAEVGASSHWSEMAQVATLDNLLSSGKIRFSQYLERLPDGYIGKKEELLEEAKKEETADAVSSADSLQPSAVSR